MALVTCGVCGWSDDIARALPSPSVYHDCRCPRCGTTKIDTSDVRLEWAARGEVYGYGNNNVLVPQTGEDG